MGPGGLDDAGDHSGGGVVVVVAAAGTVVAGTAATWAADVGRNRTEGGGKDVEGCARAGQRRCGLGGLGRQGYSGRHRRWMGRGRGPRLGLRGREGDAGGDRRRSAMPRPRLPVPGLPREDPSEGGTAPRRRRYPVDSCPGVRSWSAPCQGAPLEHEEGIGGRVSDLERFRRDRCEPQVGGLQPPREEILS